MDAVPEVLARNAVAAWGEEGRRFVEHLPAQLDEVARTWRLTVGPTYPMSFHWVCRARTADGVDAVLKLGPPGSRDLALEAATLLHYDGRGAVRVLARVEERLDAAAPSFGRFLQMSGLHPAGHGQRGGLLARLPAGHAPRVARPPLKSERALARVWRNLDAACRQRSASDIRRRFQPGSERMPESVQPQAG